MHLAILPDSLIKYLISDLLEIVKTLPPMQSGDNLNWFNTWLYAAYINKAPFEEWRPLFIL